MAVLSALDWPCNEREVKERKETGREEEGEGEKSILTIIDCIIELLTESKR